MRCVERGIQEAGLRKTGVLEAGAKKVVGGLAPQQAAGLSLGVGTDGHGVG